MTRLTLIFLAATSLLTACGEKNNAPSAMPLPTVPVVTVAAVPTTLTAELPGRVEATRTAQVRARIAGIILKRVFQEGSEVKHGDVLFLIDPAPLQAAYQSAHAALAKAEASAAHATLKAERYQALAEAHAVSQQDYDDALSAQQQARADVAAAKAALDTARLNLSYATVTAPISGRIGRALVTEGALVGQNEATPLAVIQRLDPIYVTLTQSSADVLRLRRALASGEVTHAGALKNRVTLTTEDGQPYSASGKLLFSELSVDESSGTTTLRALFPNKARLLLPGMYVRAHLPQAINQTGIAIPQQAVMRSADGAVVWVIEADGKVSVRPVVTGAVQNDQWLIRSGLQAGEQVMVEGFQKIKVGMTVQPVPWPSGSK